MNKYSSRHRLHIRTLYSESLRLIKKIGWRPGDMRENTYKPINYSNLSLSERRRIINNLDPQNLGAYVAWNLRNIYKYNKDLNNPVEIEECIDYAYHFIRNHPRFILNYSKEFLETLHCDL
tara:strand:- start:1580 stop:1942 length:363 start_codon:yes stop_codon:yes gene_type:complete